MQYHYFKKAKFFVDRLLYNNTVEDKPEREYFFTDYNHFKV